MLPCRSSVVFSENTADHETVEIRKGVDVLLFDILFVLGQLLLVLP